MGPRLGMHSFHSLSYKKINPSLVPKMPAMTQEQWENIVEYFYDQSPDSLGPQEYHRIPSLDDEHFKLKPFTDELTESSILSMVKIDTINNLVYVSDVATNSLNLLDFQGSVLEKIRITSPATSINLRDQDFDLTLSGILHPNNEDKGEIVRFVRTTKQTSFSIIDSLFRPVSSIEYDFNHDGKLDYLICEYGNDVGQLALYVQSEDEAYEQKMIEKISGAISIKIYDFNKDGYMDIIALFAQGDERVNIYYNDGQGNFLGNRKLAARFPAVYGSMHMDIFDFNKDGFMDILYVNGDNFDYSKIHKPYHGVRILENNGQDEFEEKYFFPIYGAGNAVIQDFDLDGKTDIVVAANFADMQNNPERGIIFLKNIDQYDYEPFSYELASVNQWNTMDMADLDGDGDKDILIGAMNLEKILVNQGNKGDTDGEVIPSILIMENQTR